MNISNKKKFRIKIKIYTDGFGNIKEKKYILQICKKYFLFKVWKDYKFRLIHASMYDYELDYGPLSFCSLNKLNDNVNFYSEKEITYKGYKILKYLSESTFFRYIAFTHDNYTLAGCTLDEIKQKIDSDDYVKKCQQINIKTSYL